MTRKGELLAVYQDGTNKLIDNTYEAIKEAMNGAIIDLVGLTEDTAMFVDDNGMIEALTLNVPASLFAGRALYGPVVLCGAADDEGETMEPPSDAFYAFQVLARMWGRVADDAKAKNQSLDIPANADTLPPPQIIEMTAEMFDEYLRTGEVPQ
jgi:hypothetical protein